MAVRWTELIVDANDPERLAGFWGQILGWERTGAYDEVIELAPPAGGGPTLVFAPVPEGKAGKNRLHIDLSPVGRSQDEELERLLALGARRVDVGQGDDVTWVVLADPEGNEFCLLRTPVDEE